LSETLIDHRVLSLRFEISEKRNLETPTAIYPPQPSS
jgi:hypothetical protein